MTNTQELGIGDQPNVTVTTFGRGLARITTDTPKARDVDFLGTAVRLQREDSVLRISLAVSSAVKVRLVPSSGTAFYINGGAALAAATVHTEDVALDIIRTWNLQTDDASGTTVHHLVLQEIGA